MSLKQQLAGGGATATHGTQPAAPGASGAPRAHEAARPLRSELAAEAVGTAVMLALGSGVVAASKLGAADADPLAQRQVSEILEDQTHRIRHTAVGQSSWPSTDVLKSWANGSPS